MLTEKDASRANELFTHLRRYEESLKTFSKEKEFSITYLSSDVHIPVASDIAKQIGYKYYNEEIYKIKQELADMGFSCEEKKEQAAPRNDIQSLMVGSENDFKPVLYSEELLKREVELQDRIAREALAKKYEGTYGKWSKEEASENEEVKQHFLNGGAKSEE